jgi:hypothetical protein
MGVSASIYDLPDFNAGLNACGRYDAKYLGQKIIMAFGQRILCAVDMAES